MGKARMMEWMMKWMPSCREVSALVAQDRLETASWPKRFQIRAHLFMCALCSRFARQLRLAEKAFHDRWTRAPDPEKLSAARQRLLERLSR